MVQEVFSLLRPHDPRRQKTSYTPLSSLLEIPPVKAQRAETIGAELRQLITALTQAGNDLHGVAAPALARHIKELTDSMVALSGRIAVVGQVKAGKSSFINALIQRGDLLPTHVNPWTAVATRLHFGTPGKPVTGSDFTFFTAEEWEALGRKAGEQAGLEAGFTEMKQRAEIRLGEQFHHLLGKAHFYQTVQPGILQNYLCAGPPVGEVSREIKPGRYADITKTANVYFPLPPMAVPAVVIDTPGTNDPTHLRHRITREIIEGADIYIVVITARQALASSDVTLLELLRELEKRRIVVFINRIDELNERAADAELVLTHVRDQLARVFPDVAIPVIAGSAKWAALSAVEDLETLRAGARTVPFRAFAAYVGLTIPPSDGQDGEQPALQACFRAASGLNAIARLLSLFMLSGFVSTHARGVANVLLSAADISAGNGCKRLQATAQRLCQLHEGPVINREAAEKISALVVASNVLLDIMVAELPRMREECAAAVRQGIARLETAMEADMRDFARRRQAASRASDTANAGGEAWSFDVPPPRFRPEAETVATPERSSWLSLVKQATFDILRKARAEALPAKEAEKEKKPASARSTSLTVPVTAAKDVSMDSGVAWWAEGSMAGGTADGDAGRREAAIAQTGMPGEGLDELAEDAARTGGASLAAVARLIHRLRALQETASRCTGEEKQFLDHVIEDCHATIDHACRAIVVHEKVVRRLKGIFMQRQAAE